MEGLHILYINWLFEHTPPHHLHCTWLGCIKNYIRYPSHGFLIEWWLVHSQFMDLGSPIKTVVHYLLIRRMICLGCRDGFHMMSALVYVIMHTSNLRWNMSQGYQLSWFTKLLYYMDSQPWEDIEFVQKSIKCFDL